MKKYTTGLVVISALLPLSAFANAPISIKKEIAPIIVPAVISAPAPTDKDTAQTKTVSADAIETTSDETDTEILTSEEDLSPEIIPDTIADDNVVKKARDEFRLKLREDRENMRLELKEKREKTKTEAVTTPLPTPKKTNWFKEILRKLSF